MPSYTSALYNPPSDFPALVNARKPQEFRQFLFRTPSILPQTLTHSSLFGIHAMKNMAIGSPPLRAVRRLFLWSFVFIAVFLLLKRRSPQQNRQSSALVQKYIDKGASSGGGRLFISLFCSWIITFYCFSLVYLNTNFRAIFSLSLVNPHIMARKGDAASPRWR